MDNTVYTAGNKGGRVRSDCFVTYKKRSEGGCRINIKSKVAVMFGSHIKALAEEMLAYFEIEHAELSIEDTGAMDFTIAARIEAVINTAHHTGKEFLLDQIPQNTTASTKEQFRFSRLYLPGNTPKIMLNAGIHKPNGIILDLEDSVAFNKKSEARLIVRNALRSVNFKDSERMVRINQLPTGLEDLDFIVPHGVNLILIPKCESADQIRQVEKKVNALQKISHSTIPVFYMPIIESALGIERAFEIASASENVVSVAIGLEDYTADLGVQRTKEATESLYARMRLANACIAAKVQPIDSVFSDVGDEEGLRKNLQISKSLGFQGMGCIHPRQIAVIHQEFAPKPAEIEKALKITAAFKEAESKGLGVISIGSKMIDPPVVKRALRTVQLAKKLGLISNK
ncbi:MAG: aldolase/citrate lyase family protein [Bacteroidota bacterium]|nr:aldolase/citrate lyase family protein [Bacteroidota bacterium]